MPRGLAISRGIRIAAAAAALGVALCVMQPAALAQIRENIKPPFGLSWGLSSEAMRGLLINAGGRIVESKIIKGRDCWVVEGLKQPSLKRAQFYFSGGRLVEVELQYQDSAWTPTKYDEFMLGVRRQIEGRYGPGQVIARSKTPEGKVVQTVLGYQWTQSSGTLQLYFYSAVSDSNAFRTVSLHYKMPD